MISVIAFVVVVFVCVFVYLIVRSYLSNKRKKEVERAREILFLAKVQEQRREKELKDNGQIKGTIAYVPDGHISDFAHRPFSLQNETVSDTTSVHNEAPSIPDEPITKKLSDFFD